VELTERPEAGALTNQPLLLPEQCGIAHFRDLSRWKKGSFPQFEKGTTGEENLIYFYLAWITSPQNEDFRRETAEK